MKDTDTDTNPNTSSINNNHNNDNDNTNNNNTGNDDNINPSASARLAKEPWRGVWHTLYVAQYHTILCNGQEDEDEGALRRAAEGLRGPVLYGHCSY